MRCNDLRKIFKKQNRTNFASSARSRQSINSSIQSDIHTDPVNDFAISAWYTGYESMPPDTMINRIGCNRVDPAELTSKLEPCRAVLVADDGLSRNKNTLSNKSRFGKKMVIGTSSRFIEFSVFIDNFISSNIPSISCLYAISKLPNYRKNGQQD